MEEHCDHRQDFLTIRNPSANGSVTLADLDQESSEIKTVARDDPLIDRFLTDIPELCALHATCGLIWDKGLCPHNGRYEPNMHYFPTGQQTKKSAHGLIEYYRDGRTGAVFAIKVLKEKDSFHFEEVNSRLRLQHDNIADVYGIMIRSGMVHILMEYAGTPLVNERSWFAESPERMFQLAKQCFKALCFLHVRGYVHCDVKPDNLMVVRQDNSFILKVIDFGTCRRIKQPLPPHAHTTWQYWPPEMWKSLENKEVFIADSSMDVYAMALTLYFVQTGAHLMLNMPREVMSKRPEYVKMMALPESIPVDLRFVMDHCLEVNKVSRYTAEEATDRLKETTEPCSSREEYFAKLNNVARSDGRKESFVDTLLAKGGAKPSTLHCFVGSNKSLSQGELIMGPDSTRFKRKTSFIFRKLERISSYNENGDNKREVRCRPLGEPRCSQTEESKAVSNNQTLSNNCETRQTTNLKNSYPFCFLLEKLVSQHSSKQDTSELGPAQKLAKVTPQLLPQEMMSSTSKIGKAKASSGSVRQKNRAKVRQRNYDRNQCLNKSSTRKCASQDKAYRKVEKLWPSSTTGESSFEGKKFGSTIATNVDDMEFVIDAFDPDAFKLENENNITDYMYDMLQKQENEEGSEKIRVDMDGMTLSSPDAIDKISAGTSSEKMDVTSMSLIPKEKPAKESSLHMGLPNFELIS